MWRSLGLAASPRFVCIQAIFNAHIKRITAFTRDIVALVQALNALIEALMKDHSKAISK